jgi:hypothetical protein
MLSILGNTAYDPEVRLQASIILKNQVKETWNSLDKNIRMFMKKNLVKLLMECPKLIVKQMIEILDTMVHYDYPKKWKDLDAELYSFLNSRDLNKIYNALQCLFPIIDKYSSVLRSKIRKTDKILQQINFLIDNLYPLVFSYATAMLTNVRFDEMQGLIMKSIFKLFCKMLELILPSVFTKMEEVKKFLGVAVGLYQLVIPDNICVCDLI